MNPLTSRLCLATVLVLTSLPHASANPAVDVARDWGLLGTWAGDCAAPLKLYSFEISLRRKLIYRRDHSSAQKYEIVDARVGPENTIVLATRFPALKDIRESAMIKNADGSIQALYSLSRGDGSYAIKDSVVVATGDPAPVLHRCGRRSDGKRAWR